MCSPGGDPGDVGCRIRVMKQHIANFLGNPTRILNDPRNQRILVISGFIIHFSCLLFLLLGTAPRRGETVSAEGTTATSVPTIPTITPTKWWIKTTPTSSPALPSITAPTNPVGMLSGDCPSGFSSPLQSGIYAYISLTPPSAQPYTLWRGQNKFLSWTDGAWRRRESPRRTIVC